MPGSINTELRDWYLSTLGIVQYRVRSADDKKMVSELNGLDRPMAAQKSGKSGFCERPEGALPDIIKDDNSTMTEPDLSGNVPSGVLSDTVPRGKAARVVVAQEKIRTAPDEREISQTVGTVKENAVTFRLACWRPCEDLLVMDSWPKTDDPNPELFQLLGNILRAIRRSPQNLSGPEIIDWPTGGETDLTSAQQHIAMFLRGRYEQQSFKWVLAMGEDVHRCIVTETGSSVQSGARYELACGGEAVFTPSLRDLIAEPQLKKEVWSNIRFLSMT